MNTKHNPYDDLDEKIRSDLDADIRLKFLSMYQDSPDDVEFYLTPRCEICAISKPLSFGEIDQVFSPTGVDRPTATDYLNYRAKHVTLDRKDAKNLYDLMQESLDEKGATDYQAFGDRGISFERLYDALVGDMYSKKED